MPSEFNPMCQQVSISCNLRDQSKAPPHCVADSLCLIADKQFDVLLHSPARRLQHEEWRSRHLVLSTMEREQFSLRDHFTWHVFSDEQVEDKSRCCNDFIWCVFIIPCLLPTCFILSCRIPGSYPLNTKHETLNTKAFSGLGSFGLSLFSPCAAVAIGLLKKSVTS